MELSQFNSLIPSMLLPFVAFASGEVHDWGKEIGRGWREVVWCVCVLLTCV